MKVKKIEVGSLETNCYALKSGKEVAIIDPGEDEDEIVKNIEDQNRKVSVKFVLATHFHWDHVDALPGLVERFDSPFYLGEKDLEMYEKSSGSDLKPDRLLSEGDSIELDDATLEVWETPGHSPGSITLVDRTENRLFVGDLFFSTGFGRTDLPGGSRDDLEKSLARLVNLEGNWEIFPGHGPTFHLKEKLRTSPFLSDMREG